jgi:hypothetical protein
VPETQWLWLQEELREEETWGQGTFLVVRSFILKIVHEVDGNRTALESEGELKLRQKEFW